MYGVKVVYKYVFGAGKKPPVYEEQVLYLEAESFDDALNKAEDYAETYCVCGEQVNPAGETVRIECYWILDCYMSDQEEAYSRLFNNQTGLDEEAMIDMLSDNCSRGERSPLRSARYNQSPKGRYDVHFATKDGTFNYRVCAVILHDGKLLTMRDDTSVYRYLPGGRVKIGEPAEIAVLRELREELGVNAEIVRPLWLNQAFFSERTCGESYHEMCIYFLMDVTQTDLLSRGERFIRHENCIEQEFEWIPFEKLKETDVVPHFIKEKIFDLPKTLELITNIG